MIVLRLLAIVIFVAPLTGCDVSTDIKSAKQVAAAMKVDALAMKSYLRAFREPDECLRPGDDDSSKTCYYRLLIYDDSKASAGVFSAKVDPQVFKDMAQECKKSRDTLRPKFKDLEYPCPGDADDNTYQYPDQDAVYTFSVDGIRPLDIKKGQTYDFFSVPGGTKHLIKVTEDQVKKFGK